MNKTMIVAFIGMLMLVGIATAVIEEQRTTRLTAYVRSSGMHVEGTYLDNRENPLLKGTLTIYCQGENYTEVIGTQDFRLSNSAKGKQYNFFESNYNIEHCKAGDTVYFTTNDFRSKDVTVFVKHGHKKKVVEPVIPQYELDYKQCNLDADNWYAEHENQRFSKMKYWLMQEKCEYDYKEAQCELDPLKEYKFGKCVDKRDFH